MATERYLMERYKRFLLNRATVTPVIVECIENCLSNEEETANLSYHKIMIHNWQDSLSEIFEVITSYYGTSFIPVNCTSQGELTTFYTYSLNLILKLIKFDFMFPYSRNMYNVDVLFNDKTATDFFGRITTVEDIVSGVVCRRFNEKCELNLSNFCEDPEFVNNKIWFHKLSLLSQFKILMLRMGRDTRKLILRNNNLGDAPTDILNFFIKSDLTAIDLSYNNIPSLQELRRVSSKIEQLWIEGNPLCDELDPITYAKTVASKFPRLTELDGVKFNQHGINIPFFKNFLAVPDPRTKAVVENFVANYFTNFDFTRHSKPISGFYDSKPVVTITADMPVRDLKIVHHHRLGDRNMIIEAHKKKHVADHGYRMLKSHGHVLTMFLKWPDTVHDLSTFTVDVLCHNNSVLMLVVDGIYKELATNDNKNENVYRFRKTLLFKIVTKNDMSMYKIKHEMLSVTLITDKHTRDASLKNSFISINKLTPINPSLEEKEAIFKVFQHLSQLKRPEAQSILDRHSWNIFNSIRDVAKQIRTKTITADKFITEEDDLSDISSLLDEVD